MTLQSHRYYCERLLGGMGIKRRKLKRKPRSVPCNQTSLDRFMTGLPLPSPKPFKMPYRQKMIIPLFPRGSTIPQKVSRSRHIPLTGAISNICFNLIHSLFGRLTPERLSRATSTANYRWLKFLN